MSKSRSVLVGLASLTLTDIALAEPCQHAPVPAYNWTGFYAGGHAGYRWAHANFSGPGFDGFISSSAPRSENYSLNGGIVGVQGGYNCMLTPTTLVGVEGDWSWGKSKAGASGSSVDSLGDGFMFRSEAEISWQATLRGRLGVVNGQWLIYGTGGVAFLRGRWFDSTSEIFIGNPADSISSQLSKTLTGWVVGVGLEYMWNPNWIARVEYLYENFGGIAVPFGTGPETGTLDLKDVSKLRFAISYNFR